MKKTRTYASFLLRLFLAAVFVYAGLVKLRSPGTFFENIQGYRLLPSKLCYLLAYFLPAFEVVLGLGLFFKRYAKICAHSIILLIAIFIVAIASARIRGIDISCGCFGEAAAGNYLWDIARDIVFMAAALAIIIMGESENNKL